MAIRRAASGETTRRATEYPLNNPVSLRLVTRSLRGGTRGPTARAIDDHRLARRTTAHGPAHHASEGASMSEGGYSESPATFGYSLWWASKARLVSLGGLSCWPGTQK